MRKFLVISILLVVLPALLAGFSYTQSFLVPSVEAQPKESEAKVAEEVKDTSSEKTKTATTKTEQKKVESSSIPTESYPDYPAVGKSTGVWNEGKAALWDLSLIDQYKITGATQRAEGHKPEQPINFSHIVHVQKNKMECQYCHWSVSDASYAALPDVETCMGCHNIVKGSDKAAQDEIAKIEKHYNENKPIEWVKVHVMPDHYKFNHKRHIKGGVTCHECHGQIPEMAVVERTSAMKMGWCIDCHRTQGSSIDCATCHY